MNGLAMGMVYALMVMGLVLLIRAVGVLNFAQGDILSAGAFIGCSMLIDFNLPLWLAAIVSLVLYLPVSYTHLAAGRQGSFNYRVGYDGLECVAGSGDFGNRGNPRPCFKYAHHQTH